MTVGMRRHVQVDAQIPEIRRIGVSDERKFRRELQAAIAPHSHSAWSALQKIFIRALPPGSRVLGEQWRNYESRDIEKQGKPKNNIKCCSNTLRMTAGHLLIRAWS